LARLESRSRAMAPPALKRLVEINNACLINPLARPCAY
jgi:hypothetical protein